MEHGKLVTEPCSSQQCYMMVVNEHTRKLQLSRADRNVEMHEWY
jgi:hypothetical protein